MTPVYSAIYALLTQFRFQTKGQQQHCSMIKMNSPYIFTCHSLAKIRRYRAKIFIFEFLGLRIGNIGVKLRQLGPKAANSTTIVTKKTENSPYIYVYKAADHLKEIMRYRYPSYLQKFRKPGHRYIYIC